MGCASSSSIKTSEEKDGNLGPRKKDQRQKTLEFGAKQQLDEVSRNINSDPVSPGKKVQEVLVSSETKKQNVDHNGVGNDSKATAKKSVKSEEQETENLFIHIRNNSKKRPDDGGSSSKDRYSYNASNASESSASTFILPDHSLVSPSSGEEIAYGIRRYTFQELKAVTSGFQRQSLLGRGSFGNVYLGEIEDSIEGYEGQKRLVAIKRLNRESFQGYREWLAEILYLAKLKHPRVVCLLGFCLDKSNGEALLVYEFMSNSSLDYHLFSVNPSRVLSWKQRCSIARDAAEGLRFLHAHEVIHRDVKACNVLLDNDFNACVTDFGLAKEGPEGNLSHVTTLVKGTAGYLDPLYAETGHLTKKSDVYSFGVLLLELLTGRRASGTSDRPLTAWAQPYLSERQVNLNELMDPALNGEYSRDGATKLAILAKHCTALDAEFRPEMRDLQKPLEGILLADGPCKRKEII